MSRQSPEVQVPMPASKVTPIIFSKLFSGDNALTMDDAQSSITMRKILEAFGAVVISATSVSFYIVTTQGQNFVIVGSGVGSNFFLSLYAADESIDYIKESITEGKWVQLVASGAVSLLSSGAQGLIAYLQSQERGDAQLLSILASVSTVAGMGVLNMVTLKILMPLFAAWNLGFKARRFFGILHDDEKTFEQEKRDAIKALEAARFLLSATAIDATEFPTARLTSTLVRYFGNVADVALKFALMMILLFCIMVYTCATAVALRKYVPFLEKSDERLSVGVAGLIMLAPGLLGVIGGYRLAETISSVISRLFQYGTFLIELKLGRLGRFVPFAAIFVGAVLASQSGFTTQELLQSCKDCAMRAIMFSQYSQTGEFAFISSSSYNGYFSILAFLGMFLALSRKIFPLNKTERQYLAVLSWLDTEIAAIGKITYVNKLSNRINTIDSLRNRVSEVRNRLCQLNSMRFFPAEKRVPADVGQEHSVNADLEAGERDTLVIQPAARRFCSMM
ncbi:MAG: hypothetical protein A3I77_00030 [Gammaproteobacteria bacterium RIFCSPLOWO2_02_FULL_42_14]|nr:MAG: hypothetical protein A3B71_00030 [Gammaproteobacteria bacterium RIFCSPHIGHO2_02_FULL_42_43]OGT27237.1 MAG: hypothetical protein A2624_02715 [Gammaproteobacteria bacterium RIFCSPHIGHO2_01_FULL_42_8]OGT51883.1 MAG: hypothetical protein A3E54_01055 [Gammaproteobacteria bacterium RIFCSPHIGHO2_12_FULL_41_25]OGT62397.1 MAG: hypothetical protein A3I77_00030 [Gammaproteobacteria bacterium RIFCSPLOWO2_02_FULL_42_14]OGT85349.1 MAG: hypothetical protein A3G86_07980 [Gammaproteobacteria bacterium R